MNLRLEPTALRLRVSPWLCFSVAPLGPTTSEPFAPEALYELKVDTNGDLVEDGAYRYFAGWGSDPFFFDAGGALNNRQFTGEDTFADKDVCSIILELPDNALGGTAGVNLWHRSLVQADGAGSGWVQADRGARPSQTPFLAGADRDAYLSAEPAQDARFVATFAHALEHTGGYTPQEARTVARTLLPDVLPYDHTRPAAYPANGRALTDDVVDVFLSVLTNGKATEDKVGPHADLLSEFPYVGAPHNVTQTGGGSGYGAAGH